MKKNSSFKTLLNYAGGYKYFTVGSVVLAAASACLALVPFVYIWEIVNEVMTTAPDFSKAQNIEDYGFTAVKYAVNAMCVYFCAFLAGIALLFSFLQSFDVIVEAVATFISSLLCVGLVSVLLRSLRFVKNHFIVNCKDSLKREIRERNP